jgi:hypothetical protein
MDQMTAGDFLASSTRNFLRRLSGKPSGSSQRSHSAAGSLQPSESVKVARCADRLCWLRREIEKKTERLNDGNYEVTEVWLFEFANQHAEYMEKATSSLGAGHNFRSTTDLFHHVLQHPRVLKLIGEWQPSGAAASASKFIAGSSPVPWSPASTVPPSSAECSPEHEAEDISVSTQGDASDQPMHTEVADSSDVGRPTTAGYSAFPPAKATGFGAASMKASGQQRSHSQASALRHRSFRPAPILPAAKEENELMQKMRERSQRLSSPATGLATVSSYGDGELLKKLQQRSSKKSWQGLSPRSRRLAGKVNNSDDASHVPESSGAENSGSDKLAARRKLLEGKLASCGFQKAASAGGA